MHGADAVISALGPSLSRKATGTPLVDGTRTILDAMRAEGVERYIGMATPSLRDTRDSPSLLGRTSRSWAARSSRAPTANLLAMSRLITDSALNWTIARFTRPTDGARTGAVRAGYLGSDHITASITRADIAKFLLAQTTDTRFHRAAPAISN